ncbi:MAG: hypothetical protein G3I09_04295 [Ferrovum sp.]|nr:hypothetical protein [Ferrovum sp.]
MKSIIAVTTLALILSAPAFADNGFYLGGTLGHSNSGSPSSVSMTNSTGTVAGGLIGYQFTPFFALEPPPRHSLLGSAFSTLPCGKSI